MTSPTIPLIAHFNGTRNTREVSLRVIAINAAGVMLVLWENKLIPVHHPVPGLTLDRVEIYKEEPQPPVVASVAPAKRKTEPKTTEG